ncbi:DUF542 domain-containing protein [Anatilimnocola sp. NA78]|uniref:DUF542 domain-containing protein n=1 Tax=Anatilimnocola sp. NA78 TaxID=3415683 RepID=UPI003CE5A0DB
MCKVDWEASVVDWVIDHPASIAVFEEFGIDYSCPGKSLEYACQQAGANPAAVGAKLCCAMNPAFTATQELRCDHRNTF